MLQFASAMSNEPATMTHQTKIWIWTGVAFIAVILSWLFVPGLVTPQGADLEKAGQVGDKYGSVNALFSGLAFTVLIATLFLQREELQQNTRELNAQASALKEQVRLMRISAQVSAIPIIIANEQEVVRKLYHDVFAATPQAYILNSVRELGRLLKDTQEERKKEDAIRSDLIAKATEGGVAHLLKDPPEGNRPPVVRNYLLAESALQRCLELEFRIEKLIDLTNDLSICYDSIDEPPATEG
jgi:hypothetical protein